MIWFLSLISHILACVKCYAGCANYKNIVEVQFTRGDKVNTIRGGGIEGPAPPPSGKNHSSFASVVSPIVSPSRAHLTVSLSLSNSESNVRGQDKGPWRLRCVSSKNFLSVWNRDKLSCWKEQKKGFIQQGVIYLPYWQIYDILGIGLFSPPNVWLLATSWTD